MVSSCRILQTTVIVTLLTVNTSAQENKTDSPVLQQLADSIVAHEENTPHKYRMNYWVSGGFSLVATATNIYAIPNIIKAKTNFTDEELLSLNKEVYNGFDQWALRQNPSQRDQSYKASDYLLPAIIVSTGILGFDKKIKKDWLRILMMYYETHALTFSLYNFSFFGPAFQNKPRPYVYYDEFTLDQRRGGNNRNSLYSGHTATAAASTFFLAKVYADYHPELGSKEVFIVWTGINTAVSRRVFTYESTGAFPYRHYGWLYDWCNGRNSCA